MLVQPVILSGGSGTRLWPLSREAYPKQFLPLVDDTHSLLQATALRLMGLPTEHSSHDMQMLPLMLVCNEQHRFVVAEQIRLLGMDIATILLEPIGRNTAPALTLAALQATASGQDPVLLVMPSDHKVSDTAEFCRVLVNGYTHAAHGFVVTFGIVPTTAETGYGYLHKGVMHDVATEAFVLEGFREKPNQTTAELYLASGEYYWNSGIFMLRAGTWLKFAEQLAPTIVKVCHQAFANKTSDGNFIRIDPQIFPSCPNDSIDYAVMEHLPPNQALLLPLNAGWSDLGSWASIWENRARDSQGNVVKGDVYTQAVNDCLLLAGHRTLAAVGVKDLVIVETPDVVLVLHKEQAQQVRAITQKLQAEHRKEVQQHRLCHRPWGSYDSITYGSRYQVKHLLVDPGQSLSLQMHYHRAEHWIVVSGTARVTRDNEVFLLTENQSTYIPFGVKHRLENPGTIPLEVIEVQSGSYLGEDDIVRFADIYNRQMEM